MPTFLSDPPQSLFLLLGLAVVVTGAVWFSKRTRAAAIAFLCALAVLALFVLLATMFESPREEAVRRVQLMEKAADARDGEAFAAQLADKFDYHGAGGHKVTLKRDDIRKGGFWDTLKRYNIDVATWDFARDDVREIDANTVEIGFLGKAEAEGKPLMMYFRATFARQPDGQMKLTALSSFEPMKRQNEAVTIPAAPFTNSK